MKHKNSWNKKIEIAKRTYKVRGKDGKFVNGEDGKPIKKVVKENHMVQRGLKPDRKEIAFRKAINKIKVDKPKTFKGNWVWD